MQNEGYTGNRYLKHYSQGNLLQHQRNAYEETVQKGHPYSHFTHNPNHQFSNHFEEYSFNRHSDLDKEYFDKKPNEPEPEHNDSSNTLRTNPELMNKYSSLFDELKVVNIEEVIKLFIEQVEENEANHQKNMNNQRLIDRLQDEIKEIKLILGEKRQAIRQLCQTESDNLNLIEAMERQMKHSSFKFEDHYHKKYRELEAYMNEYISNTNEAQEEFKKNYKNLKQENQRLTEANLSLNQQLFQKSKFIAISNCKRQKIDELISLMKQKEENFNQKVEYLQEENKMLKKDIQILIEKIKSNEQFDISIKDNKEFSSSFDFIREKLNCYSMGKDFLEKNEENSDFGPRSKPDKQNGEIIEMQNFISEITAEKNQLMLEKDELISQYSRISQRLQSISSDNEKLINIVEEKNKYISKLKRDIELSSQYSQEESKPAKSEAGETQQHAKFADSYSKQAKPTDRIRDVPKNFCYRQTEHKVLRQLNCNDSLEEVSCKTIKTGWSESTKNSKTTHLKYRLNPHSHDQQNEVSR